MVQRWTFALSSRTSIVSIVWCRRGLGVRERLDPSVDAICLCVVVCESERRGHRKAAVGFNDELDRSTFAVLGRDRGQSAWLEWTDARAQSLTLRRSVWVTSKSVLSALQICSRETILRQVEISLTLAYLGPVLQQNKSLFVSVS